MRLSKSVAKVFDFLAAANICLKFSEKCTSQYIAQKKTLRRGTADEAFFLVSFKLCRSILLIVLFYTVARHAFFIFDELALQRN